MFGSSGGAVTGLALVARHPGRVRTLVAHEPPLLELLPDAAAAAGGHRGHHRRRSTATGLEAAWMKFMGNAGFDLDDPATAHAGPPETDRRAGAGRGDARFFDPRPARRPRSTVPDVARAAGVGPSRVVIGIGVDSGHLLTLPDVDRAGRTARRADAVEFPGDHGGFMGAPGEFADASASCVLLEPRPRRHECGLAV